MKYIITALVLTLILISGCSKGTITAMPISEIKTAEIELDVNVTGTDPCENITCSTNEKCDNGDCICIEGYKACNDECISETMCCADSDCSDGKVCKDNECVFMNCKYSEHYDVSERDCVCDDGTRWCAEQKRCIPRKSCCMHTSCGSYQRCVLTQVRADICIKGEKLMCRSIMEDREEVFMINSERYDVVIQDVLQDSVLNITVNEEEFKLVLDETKELEANLAMYVEEIEILGGYCKDD